MHSKGTLFLREIPYYDIGPISLEVRVYRVDKSYDKVRAYYRKMSKVMKLI